MNYLMQGIIRIRLVGCVTICKTHPNKQPQRITSLALLPLMFAEFFLLVTRKRQKIIQRLFRMDENGLPLRALIRELKVEDQWVEQRNDAQINLFQNRANGSNLCRRRTRRKLHFLYVFLFYFPCTTVLVLASNPRVVVSIFFLICFRRMPRSYAETV